MAKIPDKFYRDFSGGVRRDKSPYDLKDNELLRGRNFELDDQGRIRKRRGSILFGQNLNNIIRFHHDNNGLYAADLHGTELSVWKLASTTNDSALTTSSTTIAVSPAAQLETGGSAEIDGDQFAYSAGGDGATLTTVTGLNESHNAVRAINQWKDLGAFTGHVSDEVWFTYLNALTVVMSNDVATNSDMSTINSSGTIAAVATLDVNARLLETFRDRVYTTLNNTIYYSNLGAVAFPATIEDNSFDIEDQSGEIITAIKQYRKNLLIFKKSTAYAYSGSLPVRQLSSRYGVHNDNCIQEINGLLYGFGPAGVWAGNGVSFINIGEPVKEYLDLILWRNTTTNSPLSEVKTAQIEGKFLISLGASITDPDSSLSTTTPILVYDTIKKNWSMWTNLSSVIWGMSALSNFRSGNAGLLQDGPILLFTDSTLVYRMFENRFTERVSSSGSGTQKGGDIYQDNYANASGSAITMNVVTKPFDLGLPNWKKEFGYLKVFCEKPQGMSISVIIDDGDPIPLGQCNKRINRFKFPAKANKGYRCSVVVDESSINSSCIFNGCIFEECKTISQDA